MSITQEHHLGCNSMFKKINLGIVFFPLYLLFKKISNEPFKKKKKLAPPLGYVVIKVELKFNLCLNFFLRATKSH